MASRSVALAVLVVSLGAAGPALALPGPASLADLGGEIVPGEVLVKFKPSTSAQRRRAVVASLGHAYLSPLRAEGWVHARTAPGQTVAEALAAWAEDPDVEWAQPNFVYHAAAAPDDPGYPLLWGLKNVGQTVTNQRTQPPGAPIAYPTNNPPPAGGNDMNLEPAWNHLTDCSGVVVAVVDTGVNYGHEDLAGNMWDGSGLGFPNHGRNFVGTGPDGDMNTLDLAGHGTHVAGTIGAVGDNSLGTTGVCWSARIMAVRALDAAGSGDTVSIMNGIHWALDHGAKVINMSLGGHGFDQLFSETITAAQAADAVVIAAAGNDGADDDASPVYPCGFSQPNIVCVAALDQAYALAGFSNWGATSVDVGAPGTNIVSTWPGTTGGGYDPLTGGWATSGWAFSVVSGMSALVDPSSYGTGSYANGADDRAYRTYTVLAGADVAVLRFLLAANLLDGDYFRLAFASTSGDPFPSGTVAGSITGVHTGIATFYPFSADVSACLGATCTIGFQLETDAAGSSDGIAVTDFTIETLTFDTSSYNTMNGTSMAAPAVAGVAAMLRAYNPQFTYADVVGAIEGGGRAVAALAGKTTTGKAVDAMRALAFINPPTGLTSVVH